MLVEKRDKAMNDNEATIVGSEDRVSAILGETADARGLPAHAFTSQDFFEREQHQLFARTWTCVGFAQDVPNVGDVQPVTFADLPLFLVRDANHQVRVFHNVCPHRGMRVVPESAQGLRTIQCPYHCWTYDLDGRLVRRMYFGGPEDEQGKVSAAEDTPSLTEVRSAKWLDAVFVNLDGEAPPFDEYASDFLAVAESYGDMSNAGPCGRLDYEIEANWKLVTENFVDSYHVHWVHPGLQQSTPMTSYTHEHRRNVCIGRAPLYVEGPGYGKSSLAAWCGVDRAVENQLTYIVLFPSLMVAFTPSNYTLFHLNPQSPGRTLERINLYVPDATDPALEDDRQSFVRSYEELNEEDISLVEDLQKSRHSPAFDGGRFSPHWDTLSHHLARLVARAMC